MKKKLAGLMVCCAMLAASLTGCGEKATVESLVKDMKEATEKCDSFSADVFMDFDMELSSPEDGSAMGMGFDGILSMDVNDTIFGMDGDMTVDVMGASEDLGFEAYVEMSEDKELAIYMYEDSSDEWLKITDDSMVGEMEKEATSGSVDLTDIQDKLTLAEETEKVNDVECYKLTGTLTGDDLMEIMEKQEKENGESDSESATAELESVMGEDSDMSWLKMDLTFYVDKKTKLPVSMEFDFANSDMSKIAEMLGASLGAELEVELKAANMSIDYYDFGKVDKIEIPDDAKNAPEVTLTDLLSYISSEAATEEEYYLDDESYYLEDDEYYLDDEETSADIEM